MSFSLSLTDHEIIIILFVLNNIILGFIGVSLCLIYDRLQFSIKVLQSLRQ